VPIQIEKKVFFLRLLNRFSCWQSCLLNWGLKNSKEGFDHYEDVKDRFPKAIEKVLLPYGASAKRRKMTLPTKKTNYNRVIDESVITQMSDIEAQNAKNLQRRGPNQSDFQREGSID